MNLGKNKGEILKLPIFKKLLIALEAYQTEYIPGMNQENLINNRLNLAVESSTKNLEVVLFDDEIVISNKIWAATEENYSVKVSADNHIKISPMEFLVGEFT